MNQFAPDLSFARELDAKDPLRSYRERFYIPEKDGQPVAYFCGNSLGLQPKSTREYLNRELDLWAKYGVEGHFEGPMPWKKYHHFFKEKTARLIGALPSEVVVMNTLTTNLHLMMVSFYRPTAGRYKILMEGGAFPSDQYAVESQITFNGYKYEDAAIEMFPRDGEHSLRMEDVLATIETHRNELALILLGGVNYYTGQYFDLKSIAQTAQQWNIPVGFDLAHTVGNIPLQLHDWGCDFAVWCSYKYLNSGPGGPGGVFVHERHANNPNLPRFAGWWGYKEDTRFQMRKGFQPMYGADGWQLSNAQVLSMAANMASLDIFDEVGMPALYAKSRLMAEYMLYHLQRVAEAHPGRFTMLTPTDLNARGCQTSLLSDGSGSKVFQFLLDHGVLADWREPNVIRFAPVPLYNTFEDIQRFADLLDKALTAIS